MGIAGAGLSGFFTAPWLGTGRAAETGGADLVVFNAKVYTVDAKTPKAEGFAIKAGRFVAIGGTEDVKALIGKGTQTFDAKQMTVVPGFIDCHNHAPGNTLLYDVIVGNPFVVEFVTISSIVEKLRAKAQETPPGTWVEGYFFDDTKVKDNRELNAHDLDQAVQGPSSSGAPSGRPHFVLQQQGAGDGRLQQDDTQSCRRDVRPR